MQALFELAHSVGIVVEHYPLPAQVDALYVREPQTPPIIVMSCELIENTPKYRTVFAHELGHHFTTAHDAISVRFCSYHDQIVASRVEYRASKWATDFLVPREAFITAIRQGIVDRWELANHFEVTEDVVAFRFSLLNKEGYYGSNPGVICQGVNRRTS